ncbi:MAG: dephospho-CoA kinase [Kordiimonadaceae bacterium]|nr:dephospho-CoA kinase [Kordiimonadaceae bacterium]MBO6568353.1 dephospho-CoA kinase [Kordiimonadaceae bacterium]MBO6963918.1 dephospho-CoA kinase [Kordiimonadaceae bacterium]
MKIVGLTGSIGMGKSETAKMFRALGVPVFDADAAVHELQAKNGPAIPAIAAEFPGVINDGELDRDALGKIVFADPTAKQKLEAIIHPMVAEKRIAFFEEAEANGSKFMVLDVPLLFETGGNEACDKVVVVSAPADVQRERVLARPGMSEEKFNNIVARQTPDSEKRAGADYIVESDKGLEYARDQVAQIVAELQKDSA